MEVLFGRAFTIEVPSSPEYGDEHLMDNEGGSDDAVTESEVSTSFFAGGSGFRVGGQEGFFAGDSSESSSSIGTPDNSDDENDDVSSQKGDDDEEGKEVQSTLKGLDSLDSLQDSLPTKSGLSTYFGGKSKSFTDLSQVSSVNDLQKEENPFNKRRRVQIASKWSRRQSFYANYNPKSMPLLTLNEEDNEAEEENEEEKQKDIKGSPSQPTSSSAGEKNRVPPLSYADHMRRRLGSFKSRSYSLPDLPEYDEEDLPKHDEKEEDNGDDDDDDDDNY